MLRNVRRDILPDCRAVLSCPGCEAPPAPEAGMNPGTEPCAKPTSTPGTKPGGTPGINPCVLEDEPPGEPGGVIADKLKAEGLTGPPESGAEDASPPGPWDIGWDAALPGEAAVF
jgi:hypothetical protein